MAADLRLHFGLGTATLAELVVITWPSGQVQYLTAVPANQVVVVEEPQMTLRAPATIGATTHLDLSIPGDAGLSYVMALALGEFPHFPLPDGRALPIFATGVSLDQVWFGGVRTLFPRPVQHHAAVAVDAHRRDRGDVAVTATESDLRN